MSPGHDDGLGYQLGVDLGTTYTAAAVHRDGRAETVGLGNRSDSIPSVVLLRSDDTILAGEAATRRAVTEPDRVARQFKRRVGDPTPLVLGGSPCSAESLTGKLLRWVHDTVTEREGGVPERISVTYPANWGPYKQDLLHQAIRIADLQAETLTEPEAAAIFYASQERVDPGTVVAVYDLGGGTFDAAVLRKTDEDNWDILGAPEGIERLGGVDFDEAVFDYVRRALGGAVEELDPSDPASLASMARLREECVAGKEALSTDTDVSIPVLMPTVHTEVRLTRAEFESMIRPTLADTIDALQRALRAAEVKPADVDKVLLVGGSSRIPLVGQLVSADLGRPVAVDAHPKHAIALGAALAASTETPSVPADMGPALHREPVGGGPAVAIPPRADATAATSSPDGPPDAPSAVPPPEPERAEPPPRNRRLVLAGATAAATVIAVVAVLLLSGGDGDPDDGGPAAASATKSTGSVVASPTTHSMSHTTSTPQEAAPTTTATSAVAAPTGPFVDVTAIRVDRSVYAISFIPHEFTPSISPGPLHVHFFWNTTPRESAGTNGVPSPGSWLVYDGPSPAVDPFFDVSQRPAGATEICALVADTQHAIADLDGDGQPDPGSGGCAPIP